MKSASFGHKSEICAKYVKYEVLRAVSRLRAAPGAHRIEGTGTMARADDAAHDVAAILARRAVGPRHRAVAHRPGYQHEGRAGGGARRGSPVPPGTRHLGSTENSKNIPFLVHAGVGRIGRRGWHPLSSQAEGQTILG